jgi:copper oxidase (laccase) domain-containing protein
VHAGWRGTVSRVTISAIRAMSAKWSTTPQDLHAAIGPGIGKCCFEVGPEVAIQFGEPGGRTRIDLAEANRCQLIEAGVAPERIYMSGLCTFCHGEQFHSFRRDRELAGRMMSFVGVRAPRTQPARE